MEIYRGQQSMALTKCEKQVIVEVHEMNASLTDEDSQDHHAQALVLPVQLDCTVPIACPRTKLWHKTREITRLAYTRTKITIDDNRSQHKPISSAQLFNHYYVQPLDERSGKNKRILLGSCLPKAKIRDGLGNIQNVIHAASHNYLGLYKQDEQTEQLHDLCLDNLPLTSIAPALEATMHEKIAQLFEADFCYSTSTGYGSNLLAFPAILDSEWLVVLDEKSHNSMLVGAYLSDAALVRKFRHQDMEHLREILQETHYKFKHVLVAVEGFYSMDGATPPLDKLAKLKNRFNFTLLADEAHSMLCLEKTGRGCVEIWNDDHPMQALPFSLFDIRTATLSKACGSIGGIVCGTAKFQQAVRARRDELLVQGSEPVTATTFVQTLHVLGRPTRVRQCLRRLKSMATYMRCELARFGMHVYGDANIPVLPIHTGRPSLAAKLSYVLRKRGVLASPISTPATAFWESRVRITLSAGFDDSTVDRLICTLVDAAREVGLITTTVMKPRTFQFMDTQTDTFLEDEEQEGRATERMLQELILHDSQTLTSIPRPNTQIINSGHASRQQYGIASGASRWMTGTFAVHLEVEQAIANLTQLSDVMTYPDSYLGLMSTMAALCRPVIGYKQHYLFLPDNAPVAVLDGFKVAPRKGSPTIIKYDGKSIKSLVSGIQALAGKKVYVTIYIDSTSTFRNSHSLDRDLSSVCEMGGCGMTILLNNFEKPGHISQVDMVDLVKHCSAEILVFESFYQTLGLPGAYLAGNTHLVDELRYTSRGYMFTTSQMPFLMGMVAEALRS